jgi:ElaA protein
LRWQVSTFEQLDNTALYQLMKLRQDVFVIEQTCFYPDLDDTDQRALHMCGWHGEQLTAYLRSFAPGDCYTQSALGRIVVAPSARGTQLGRELVQRGIDYNLASWPGNDIKIGAQAHLANFYGSLGFVAEGEEYIEDDIPHIHMIYSRG